jgi:hypothetical protein
MANEKKKISFGAVAFDLLLTALFFLGFTALVWTNVPSENPTTILLGAVFTASSAAGVFWLALQMFKVTLAAQRQIRAEKAAASRK